MTATNPYRLPRTVEPIRYALTVAPDLDAATFTGTAEIEVLVLESVREIKLNAAELELGSARLTDASGRVIEATVSLDAEAEVATLTLESYAEPGTWTVGVSFDGILNDKLRGFYRSTFTDAAGKSQLIATTQFEATDARRAFPCWDEPDFKAVFSIALIVADELTALSNGAVVSDTNLGNGTRRVQFLDTMKMSTYLVAFIVGEFVVSEVVDVDGVELRVACVPGKQALAPFALEAGAAALRYLTDYFSIGYPGGKLDLVAIPDFAFGAMENLGCVTFRETALLVDPQRASRLEIERVADVVAHEIAHMWFGDLVTMKWWNGIWLNEAFATFMQMSFTDHFRPDWGRWVSFGVAKAAAMNIDSLSATRPIEFEVLHPAQAQAMFDLLTYQKGAAVLRMLEQHLGPADFALGISAYLKQHAYANAETTDLWDALETSSAQPVRSIMDSWIFQGGHPVVQVELNDDESSLLLSQRRFRYFGDEDAQTLWQVPIGIRVGTPAGEVNERMLLSGASATLALPVDANWLIANDGAHGFYRVAYSRKLLDRLGENLDALQPLERFALITDTWALCLAGRTDLDSVLALLRSLAADDDPDVWGAMLAPLRVIDRLLDTASRDGFARFVRELAEVKFATLGWVPAATDTERRRTLRGVLLSALGVLGGDDAVRAEAISRYQAYENGEDALDSNLVQPVEAVLASTNETGQYDLLRAKFLAGAPTPQEKLNALGALARFTDPTLVERTLQLLLSDDVRSQDAPYAIAVMLNQAGSADKVWAWCEQHWDELLARFPANSIGRMIDGAAGQVHGELIDRMTAFLQSHPVAQAAKSISQTCERLAVNARFYRDNVVAVRGLFGS